MKKIIFILSEKFTKRDYARLGFDYLIKKKYKVEAWESPSEYTKEYSSYMPSDIFYFDGYKSFTNLDEKNNAMMHLSKNDIVIDLNGREIYNPHLSKDCKVGFLMLGQIAKPYTNNYDKFFFLLKKIIYDPKNFFSKLNKLFFTKTKKK